MQEDVTFEQNSAACCGCLWATTSTNIYPLAFYYMVNHFITEIVLDDSEQNSRTPAGLIRWNVVDKLLG